MSVVNRRSLISSTLALPWARVATSAEGVTFKRGNMSEPDSLDPHQASGNWEFNILGDLFLGLTTEDARAKPIPGTAESWSVAADNLTWTFKLRPDMVWSDGVPVRASDFVFGFRRLLNPMTAARYASLQYGIKNALRVNTGKAPPDELGVRAIDDHTLEIVTETPLPYLPGLLTHYTAYGLPEHVVVAHGDAWTKPGKMVSNGPYVLERWDPNAIVRIVKNPRFYDAANIAIDTVEFFPIEDENAALTQFRSGQIDANIGPRGFPTAELPWLRENMPDEHVIVPQLAIDYIVTNQRLKPWNDPRVRRALSLALDRNTVTAKVNRDGRLPAYSFIPPGISNYTEPPRLDFAAWSKEQRQAEARRLLADAGFGPRNPLRFIYNFPTGRDGRRQAVAEIALWAEIGVYAQLIVNETKVHYNLLKEKDFEVSWAAWVADYDDPETFLYLLDSRSTGFNYGSYNNPRFDALMDEARRTLDIDHRASLMAEAERLILDETAVIPTAFRTSRMLIAKYVKGFQGNGKNIHRTRWMRIEGRPT